MAATLRWHAPPARYWLLIPIGLIIPFAPALILPDFADEMMVRATAWAIGGLMILAWALAPWIEDDAQEKEMDAQLHLFLTYARTLGLSEMKFVDLLERLGGAEEYGHLATEMKRSVTLVRDWNLAPSTALEFVADRTRIQPMESFLQRMAYSVDVGQDTSRFLAQEKDIVMDHYQARYDRDVGQIGDFRTLFISLMNSIIFFGSFLFLMPIFIPISTTVLVGGSMVVFGLVLVLSYRYLGVRTPQDPLWQPLDLRSPREALSHPRVYSADLPFVLGLVLSVWLALQLVGRDLLPFEWALGVALIPLLVAGAWIVRVEGRLREVDETLPVFIRSLGRAQGIKGESSAGALQKLRLHNHGLLNRTVDRLFRRLRVGIEPGLAWDLFRREGRSFLLDRYVTMFQRSTDEGGNALDISAEIDVNATMMAGLRQQRWQIASSFQGMYYGLMVTAAIGFSVSLVVIQEVSRLTEGIALDAASTGAGFLANMQVAAERLPIFWVATTSILALQALISAVTIRRLRGGHIGIAGMHFSLLLVAGIIMQQAVRRSAGLVFG